MLQKIECYLRNEKNNLCFGHFCSQSWWSRMRFSIYTTRTTGIVDWPLSNESPASVKKHLISNTNLPDYEKSLFPPAKIRYPQTLLGFAKCNETTARYQLIFCHWRHNVSRLSALLALCGTHHKGPVMRSSDVFVAVRISKLFNKRFNCGWSEIPWHSCYVNVILNPLPVSLASTTRRRVCRSQLWWKWFLLSINSCIMTPDSKAHGANMGPIWPHVGSMNFVIWDSIMNDWRFAKECYYHIESHTLGDIIMESYLLKNLIFQFRLLIHFDIYLKTIGLEWSLYSAIVGNVDFNMNNNAVNEQT